MDTAFPRCPNFLCEWHWASPGADCDRSCFRADLHAGEKTEYGKLPVCIAKTQYSFSDDTKNLECNNKYNIHVRDVELKAGAGFIVVLAGKIMTMPGLPKIPAAEQIDIDENDNIIGIF